MLFYNLTLHFHVVYTGLRNFVCFFRVNKNNKTPQRPSHYVWINTKIKLELKAVMSGFPALMKSLTGGPYLHGCSRHLVALDFI